ncbi:hypothetical protein AVEN_207545-1 [Araneus ventricosus]|uniref:Uncharacterized protein n=1 Tax=Araneus ventricosus TaxID=182803 RepID=A0A4Y2RKV5_ARAVE|nr:hypothetical protein AVEN_207545-1 [Araneus ventricosus]
MTRTTPEMTPFLHASAPNQRKDVSLTTLDLASIHGGSSVEIGTGTIQPQATSNSTSARRTLDSKIKLVSTICFNYAFTASYNLSSQLGM